MLADDAVTARVTGLYQVLQYVRPLHRYVAQAVADRLTGTGVTVAARAVLERLCLDGPAPVPQLARTLSLPRQAVQRVVNELLEAGLVETVPNPLHRRSHLLAATASGSATLQAVRAREDASLARLAAALTADEVAAAVRVLAALTGHFRDEVTAHRAAGPPSPDTDTDTDTHGETDIDVDADIHRDLEESP
jgi:DNA-binding MarR family transcriptional regulator